MIDTHIHLLSEQFDVDRAEVLARARDAGVQAVVEIGLTVEGSRRAVELAERHPDVFAVIGFHPNHASEARPGDVDALFQMSSHPKVVGWGEIGMDFFRDYAPREAQEPLFREQIRAARAADLPIVIHQRAAEDDVLRILEEEGATGGRPVNLHCFGSGPETARRAMGHGWYVGIGGAFTYGKRPRPGEAAPPSPVREALAHILRERLLLETDAPYLAPTPHRGKRNEPALMRHTALALAEALGITLAGLEALTDANTRRFYHRLPPAQGSPA